MIRLYQRSKLTGTRAVIPLVIPCLHLTRRPSLLLATTSSFTGLHLTENKPVIITKHLIITMTLASAKRQCEGRPQLRCILVNLISSKLISDCNNNLLGNTLKSIKGATILSHHRSRRIISAYFYHKGVGEEGRQQAFSAQTRSPLSLLKGSGGVCCTNSESMPCEQVVWVAHHTIDGRK